MSYEGLIKESEFGIYVEGPVHKDVTEHGNVIRNKDIE